MKIYDEIEQRNRLDRAQERNCSSRNYYRFYLASNSGLSKDRVSFWLGGQKGNLGTRNTIKGRPSFCKVIIFSIRPSFEEARLLISFMPLSLSLLLQLFIQFLLHYACHLPPTSLIAPFTKTLIESPSWNITLFS
ncbi:uncharacterized protein [Henckelia pumila]|uniref:uncharacterized protein isoform X3 n=1 Tax=Henckelia pumila TaxID=405737 RepID=UPI003C6DF9C8